MTGGKRITKEELERRKECRLALRAFLKKNSVTQAEAARALGLTIPTFNQRITHKYMTPTEEMWTGLREYVARREKPAKRPYRKPPEDPAVTAAKAELALARQERRDYVRQLLERNNVKKKDAAAILELTPSAFRNMLCDDRQAPSDEMTKRLEDWIASGR